MEQGEATAQNNLGVCYENGRGVPKDYAIAAKWYGRAGAEEKKNSVLKKFVFKSCLQTGLGIRKKKDSN